MDEATNQESRPIIPAISFSLPKLFLSGRSLENVPTYVSKAVSDGTMTSIDGRLNGQPFHAAWPPGFYFNDPEQSIYLKLYFPQQAIAFYERTRGIQGHAFAINYLKREPEERDEERRKIIHIHLHAGQEGRYVFDTDPEINMEHLERLKAIAAYLKPTLRMWCKIGRVNAVKLINADGAGTIESLVVPSG